MKTVAAREQSVDGSHGWVSVASVLVVAVASLLDGAMAG